MGYYAQLERELETKKMVDNINLKTYDNRFIRILFLAVICSVIPPFVLSFVTTWLWPVNWILAAIIYVVGALVGWFLVFYCTISFVKFISIELRLELHRLYGAFDEDGMPIAEVKETATGFAAAGSPTTD